MRVYVCVVCVQAAPLSLVKCVREPSDKWTKHCVVTSKNAYIYAKSHNSVWPYNYVADV